MADTENNPSRKYRQAMEAEYASRAKMLGKTPAQYVKDQATKENKASKEAPIENFMTDTNYKKGGAVRSASSRADGIAVKGKTRGKMY